MKRLFPYLFIALIIMGASSLSQEDKRVSMVDTASKSTVSVMADLTSLGSGFFVGENYILTAYHVVKDAKSVHVSGNRGGGYHDVVAYDTKFDLALIKTSYFLPGTPLKLATSVSNGQDAYMIGYPGKLDRMVTRGIISHVYDDSKMRGIIADINAYSGNSGSPILNSKGEVVGMLKALHEKDTSYMVVVHYKDIQRFLERNGVL